VIALPCLPEIDRQRWAFLEKRGYMQKIFIESANALYLPLES
jgi:hypothetical protein